MDKNTWLTFEGQYNNIILFLIILIYLRNLFIEIIFFLHKSVSKDLTDRFFLTNYLAFSLDLTQIFIFLYDCTIKGTDLMMLIDFKQILKPNVILTLSIINGFIFYFIFILILKDSNKINTPNRIIKCLLIENLTMLWYKF